MACCASFSGDSTPKGAEQSHGGWDRGSRWRPEQKRAQWRGGIPGQLISSCLQTRALPHLLCAGCPTFSLPGGTGRGTAGPRAAWAHRLAPPSPPAGLGQAAKVLLPLPPGGDGGQQQPQKRLSAELRRYTLCQKLQAIFESVLCLLISLCLNFKIKFAHFKPVTLA